MTQTDAVLASVKKTSNLGFLDQRLGNLYGDVKYVISNNIKAYYGITGTVSLICLRNGGKLKISFLFLQFQIYHITYVDENGVTREMNKCSGFTLDSMVSGGSLNQQVFDELISNAVNKKKSSKGFHQLKSKIGKNSSIPTMVHQKCYLNNDLSKKRIPLKNFSSLPFGYKAKMVPDENLL